jgi:FkbM family methyltransferase
MVQTALPQIEQRLRLLQGVGGWASVDDEVTVAVRCLPDAGAVVFDVGARVGVWSRALLARAGSKVGRIYAFEPASPHRAALAELPADVVEHVAMAVSATNGHATLFADGAGSVLASLHRRRLGHFGLAHVAQEEVSTVTLDAFCGQRGIERIDFLKMDIEGHELEALRGAERLLRERRIEALSFEFGGCNIDSRTYFQDFWYLLTGVGFRLGRVLPGGRVARITSYAESLEAFATTTYLATAR